MKKYIALLTIALLLPTLSIAAEREILIDSVVASVDGRPITLADVTDRMKTGRRLTLSEAAENAEARFVLDQIIMEKLILSEAEQKRVGVSDREVESYIDEVATRNEMSRKVFEKALKREGKDIDTYRKQIEVEILKSKIAGSMVKSGVGVTDEEIEGFIEANPSLSKSGAKIKLSQIFISFKDRSKEEATKIASDLSSRLEEGGDFASLAAEHSESPEAKEGGSLGVIPEDDLSSYIFEAVFNLEEGDISEPTSSSRGMHVFKVDERFVDDSDEAEEELQDEVRQVIKRQKLENLMRDYFTVDVFKNHSVDKKI